MSNLHPFLAAVQSAHEAHGLPEGINAVTIYGARWGVGPFEVSLNQDGRIGSDYRGHGATLADALAEAEAVKRVAEAMRADDDAKRDARELLAAAGISPSLIAA